MLLNDEIKSLEQELRYTKEREKELVESIIKEHLTQRWDINDKSLDKEFKRAVCYVSKWAKSYIFTKRLRRYDEIKSNVFIAEQNDKEYKCLKLKYVSELINWESAFKNYINDNPRIWSLKEWKESLSQEKMIEIAEKQFKDNIFIVNHSKIKVKDIIVIKLPRKYE